MITRIFGSRVGVAIFTGLAAVTMATIVFATIPGSDGMVQACYANGNGDLRIIDGAIDSCRAQETAISWSRSGIVGYEVISGPSVVVPYGGPGVVTRALCTPGKRVLGGGYHSNNVHIIQSFPQPQFSPAPAWQVYATNDSGGDGNVSAYVICAMATP